MRSNPSAVCAALTIAAKAHPRQRTAQLIRNALRPYGGRYCVDDEVLAQALLEYAAMHKEIQSEK